jgi:hypothetical protein
MKRRQPICCFLLLGCVAIGARPAAGQPGAVPSPPPPAMSILTIGIAAAGEELTRLQAAVATLDGLFAQEQLWRNFEIVARQHPRIFVGPSFGTNGTATPAEALALLHGRNGAYTPFPAQLSLTGTYYNQGPDFTGRCRNPAGVEIDCRNTAIRQNYSNLLAVTHGIGLFAANRREIVSIEIGREIFDRYNSTSAVRRSCTFNTLAHEWTHTIGKVQDAHWAVVEDTGVSVAPGVPRLSYLFGAVAQCTWLQGQGGTQALASAARFLRKCAP